nr:immunoglobulin heavy chain junction region [Macaca mulatta]
CARGGTANTAEYYYGLDSW